MWCPGALGGDDQLFGSGGNDRLYGGIGNDTLDRGEGDDIFFFAPRGGADTVGDFGDGEDKINLSTFADIRSMEDLFIAQQGNNLLIDLSGQDGNTVELWNITETELTDAHFII